MADDINQLLEEEEQVDKALATPEEPAISAPETPGASPSVPAPQQPPKTKKEKKAKEPQKEAGTPPTEPDEVQEPTIASAEPTTEPSESEPAPEAPEQTTPTDEDQEASQETTDTQPSEITPRESVIAEKGVGKKLAGHIILETSDNPQSKWYVIHTYSGHEARVAENLKQRVQSLGLVGHVQEMFIPTQDKIEIRSGKKYTVTEKIFPGYLLVRMILDDPTWLAVRTTPGVTGFVGTGSKPIPLSNDEVGTIQKFATIGAPKFKTKFSLGEAVRITDGPFADYMGSVNSIDEERGRLKVLVSIFGRETPVELDFLQVTKI